MGLIPENWRRAISFEDAQDVLRTLNRGKSKAEQQQEEMAKLEAQKKKVELEAEIRKSKREVYMAEKDETIEELAKQYEEQGKSPVMAKRLARMMVGEGSSGGGGDSFDGLIKVLMVERMMGSGNKPSPWGEAGAEFLKGLASKAGQVMGDVIETAKDRLITPSTPPQSGDISLEDAKTLPENRRLLWRKAPDGWQLENLPAVAQGNGQPPVSPADIIAQAMQNYNAIFNGVAAAAEQMGYVKAQPGRVNHQESFDVDLDPETGKVQMHLPKTRASGEAIMNYALKKGELDHKERIENERMAALWQAVSWFAGMGTPADVYQQAKQSAEALTAKYRKKEVPVAEEPVSEPSSPVVAEEETIGVATPIMGEEIASKSENTYL